MRKTICLVDDLVLSIIFFSISLSSGFHCLLSLLLLALGMAVGISLWKNKTLIDLVLCCGRSSRFRDFVAIEVALSRDWEEVVTIVQRKNYGCWCCCERDADKVYCQLLVRILGVEASTVGDGGWTLNECDYFGLFSHRKVTGLVCLFLFLFFKKKDFWSVQGVWGGIRENVFMFFCCCLWDLFIFFFWSVVTIYSILNPSTFQTFLKIPFYFLDFSRMFFYFLDFFRVSFLLS